MIKQKEQVKEFLETLFYGLKGYIELRTINSNKDKKQFFYSTGDIERLPKDLDNEFFESTNVYFGVCPREKKIGKEEYVKQVNCLWVDLDCDSEEERENNLKKLNSFNPFPSIIVCSGRGYHCYWLLVNPFQITSNKDKLFIKGILKGLCREVNADHCFDLSRVLRVPYTYNLKDPNNPLPVKIISFNPERKYTIYNFENYRVELNDFKISDIELEEVEIPGRFYRTLDKDKKLKNTWEGNRSDLEDQTRSGYDMSLADQLVSYDFNDSEIAAIIKKFPSGKNKDAKIAYLKHTIGKARDYYKNRNKKPDVESKDAVQKIAKSKFNPRPYSDQIRSEYHLKYDKYKRFWIYNKFGIWEYQAEPILNSILRKKILGNVDYKRYCVDEIIADLKGLTYTQELLQEPEPHLIPFNNGIYDIKNNRLIEYSPNYFFINKLPVDFNEKHKKCRKIDRIFSELVGPEDVITLYEIIAYCFYRAYPYPKIFILYGNGGNGKTAYTKILNRILGKENISLVNCNELQNNRFASSQLFGKLCNISGEMEYSTLKNTSILKECCGEDLINCERKFKEPFPFTNGAKMVFLTNQVPLTADRSQAFYRRIFLLEFPNQFIIGEKADPQIINKIPQKEIEGLVWKCIQKLRKLKKRGFVFTQHENTGKIIKKYERLSNPLVEFLDDYTEKDINDNIPIKDFKEKLSVFLKEKNQLAWSSKKLNSAMNEEGFSQKACAENIEEGQKFYRAWIGIKWKG